MRDLWEEGISSDGSTGRLALAANRAWAAASHVGLVGCGGAGGAAGGGVTAA